MEDNPPSIPTSEEKQTVYCYILECNDGTYYTGWTVDVNRRIKKHQSGNGAKYTRQRRPVRLVYVEEQPSRPDAMRRERQLKRLKRERKVVLIEKFRAG